MHIIASQINPRVGDLKGNTARIISSIKNAERSGADLVVFPELALTGYPPKDFLLLPAFMDEVEESLKEIVFSSAGIGVILGIPRRIPEKKRSGFYAGLYNSAALILDRKLIDFADKILLPSYDVFDEKRYFEPGKRCSVWDFKGVRIGITICEDVWGHLSSLSETSYSEDPVSDLKNRKLDLLVNLSASPYSFSKFEKRLNTFFSVARTLKCPILFCNQTGANDGLIFDGYSFYLSPEKILKRAGGFVEEDLSVEFPVPESGAGETVDFDLLSDPTEDLYRALITGVRDYFFKSGFKRACLGLSGGIDSAVTACIAVEALGKESVSGLIMPSRYSSPQSMEDARILADKLKIETIEISIEPAFKSYLKMLDPFFEGKEPDLTEENLQARIRGMLLMAFSNKFGSLVLSTSNKSECATGFATLYGDLTGALGVLGDVTKGRVYALARSINREKEIIPNNTICRPPSAELRFEQKDSDSLPDYDVVDCVIQAYIEDYRSPEWIADHFDYSIDIVKEIVRRIYLNEYKRRQSPLSIRVSEKSFSTGRQFPIVQGWVT